MHLNDIVLLLISEILNDIGLKKPLLNGRSLDARLHAIDDSAVPMHVCTRACMSVYCMQTDSEHVLSNGGATLEELPGLLLKICSFHIMLFLMSTSLT